MRIITRLIAWMLVLAMLPVPAAVAEEALRGYDQEAGYVYVTLGTFPQMKTERGSPLCGVCCRCRTAGRTC